MIREAPFTFTCDGDQLVGIVTEPPEGTPPNPIGVLIVVGGPQYRSGSHRMFTQLARGLARAGTPAMRFDIRGMGDSSGEHPGFENTRHDIAAALEEFRSRTGVSSVVLWGLCDGASAAALYDPDDSSVVGVFLLNPWVRTEAGEAKTTIRYYYLDRLRDPSFWKRLLTGRVKLFRSAAGLASHGVKALGSSGIGEGGSLADRMADRLSSSGRKSWIVLSGNDGVAQEFRDLALPSPPWQRTVEETSASIHLLGEANHTVSDEPDLLRVIKLTIGASRDDAGRAAPASD